MMNQRTTRSMRSSGVAPAEMAASSSQGSPQYAENSTRETGERMKEGLQGLRMFRPSHKASHNTFRQSCERNDDRISLDASWPARMDKSRTQSCWTCRL